MSTVLRTFTSRITGHSRFYTSRYTGSLSSRGLHPIIAQQPLYRAPVPSITVISRRSYVVDPQASKARAKTLIGIFNWKSSTLFVLTGAALFWYFRNEKAKVEQTRKEQFATKSYGKPKLGGPFELIDHHGNMRTDRDFLGKFMLVYFGFTHCPDICPEELDKMAEVVDELDKVPEFKDKVIPIFITCDPQRDTVERVRDYVKEFHAKMVGLTGTHEQVAQAARAYRVYYSKPPKIEAGEDYLVDHSIFFYLMNPHGQLSDFYGKDYSAEYVTNSVQQYIRDYLATTGGQWPTITTPATPSNKDVVTSTTTSTK